MESRRSEPNAAQIGSSASVSEMAPVSMKRSNGIARGRSAAPIAAAAARSGGRGAPRSTPDEQADQKERCEHERVSLLDAVREDGSERGDDEQQRDRERHGSRGEGADLRAEPPSERDDDDRGRHRHDTEVEVELRQVVQEEARHGLGPVVAVADDGIGAEKVTERPATHGLDAQHQH